MHKSIELVRGLRRAEVKELRVSYTNFDGVKGSRMFPELTNRTVLPPVEKRRRNKYFL